MAVFYVFQGETYNEECSGGYVWSPQRTKSGGKNAGYTTMTHVKKGDFILHNSNTKIMAISIAQVDCYEAMQPAALKAANTSVDWDNEGYRIDTEYFTFDTPLKITNYMEWFSQHYQKDSAFMVNGRGKQQYMCHLAPEHAVFILEKAATIQKETGLLKTIQSALTEILDDKDPEYDVIEQEEINSLLDDETGFPEWRGEMTAQETVTSSATGRELPKRDPKRAADALKRAGYSCEVNAEDRIFLRKNGKGYTEPHHLIPISKYREFNYSLDVMENIVSLCSHCHNLLHYGRFEDKEPILEKLYHERIEALKKCGLDLSLEQLKGYYR
nr:MAG TPA: putative restriction endonuclease [Caudoviricetes sp.]